MDIRFEGLEEVLDSIEDIADTSDLASAMGKACAVVTAAAIEKAPRDTGALRRSITSKVEHGSDITGIVFTPLEYAPYVEYGTGIHAEKGGRTNVPWLYQRDDGEYRYTSGQHPKPFMKPALDESRNEIIRLIKGAFAK